MALDRSKMNSLFKTQDASDKPCLCCGRAHRKLTLHDGRYWLGGNCANDYKRFKKNSDPGSTWWVGYEKKHAQLSKMVSAS